jgi:hypothetical protein
MRSLGRAPGLGAALGAKLMKRDIAAFKFVGLTRPLRSAVVTAEMQKLAHPAVECAALTIDVTEVWMLIAALTVLGISRAFAVKSNTQL